MDLTTLAVYAAQQQLVLEGRSVANTTNASFNTYMRHNLVALLRAFGYATTEKRIPGLN